MDKVVNSGLVNQKQKKGNDQKIQLFSSTSSSAPLKCLAFILFNSLFVLLAFKSAIEIFFLLAKYFPAHMEAKAGVFTDHFCSHFQLQSNIVHYHLCLLSPKSCFKCVICIQNILESALIMFSQQLQE